MSTEDRAPKPDGIDHADALFRYKGDRPESLTHRDADEIVSRAKAASSSRAVRERLEPRPSAAS